MTKVKGPKNGTLITASFDGQIKSQFPNLKTTKDLVLLSISGNEYCTGDYLGAIVQTATNKHESGLTTFLIADELYWHNLKGLKPELDDIDALKAQAISLGDNYFKANLSHFLAPLSISLKEFNRVYGQHTIDQQIAQLNKIAVSLGKNFEIKRWKSWISQNNAQLTISKLTPLYDSVGGLKNSVSENIAAFAARQAEDKASLELWLHRSHGYITEECPSIMWLAAKLGYNFIIYPGSMPSSFQATKDYFVVEQHKDKIINGENSLSECHHSEHCVHVQKTIQLVNWLEVNFKRSLPQVARPTEVNAHAFFKPANKNTPVDEKFDMTDDVLDQMTSSLIEGIFRAFADSTMNYSSATAAAAAAPTKANLTLSVVFHSIEKGIMETELPAQTKLQLVSILTEKYVSNSINDRSIRTKELN